MLLTEQQLFEFPSRYERRMRSWAAVALPADVDVTVTVERQDLDLPQIENASQVSSAYMLYYVAHVCVNLANLQASNKQVLNISLLMTDDILDEAVIGLLHRTFAILLRKTFCFND